MCNISLTETAIKQDLLTSNILSEHLDRCSRSYLNRSEGAILRFIYDRTISWKKISEKISIKHFVQGVKNRKNNEIIYHSGTGYKDRTVRKAIKSFVVKNIIIAKKKEFPKSWYDQIMEFTINFNHEFFSRLDFKYDGVRVKKSKTTTDKRERKNAIDSYEKLPEYNKYNKEKENRGEVENKFQHTKEVCKPNSKITVSDFLEVWKDCVIKSHHAYKDLLVTEKEKGQVKNLINILRKQFIMYENGNEYEGIAISEFIEFVVGRWSLITHKNFKSMRQKNPDRFPNNPDLNFVLGFYKVFLNQFWDCKNGLKIEKEEMELNDYQKEVMRLVRSGYDIEEARKEADFKFNRALAAKAYNLDKQTKEAAKEKQETFEKRKEVTKALEDIKSGKYLEEKEKEFDKAIAKVKQVEKDLHAQVELKKETREVELKAHVEEITLSRKQETNSEIASLIDGIIKLSDETYVDKRYDGESDYEYKKRLKATLECVKDLII